MTTPERKLPKASQWETLPAWAEAIEPGALLAWAGMGFSDVLVAHLGLYAVQTGQAVFHTDRTGKTDLTQEQAHVFITETLGGAPVRCEYDQTTGNPWTEYMLPSGVMSYRTWRDGTKTQAEVMYQGLSESVCRTISEFAHLHLSHEKGLGPVHAIVKSSRGFSTRQLGVAGTDLEEGNYSPEVLEAYRHVVSDLQSADPCGRLVLLDGPPGTGKTYLVRALLKSCPDATFVLLPPHLTSELAGPDLVMCMTNVRNEAKGPVILIIEDGERVLLPRASDNDMSVSSMLNICDGIFGTITDMRVLVTTNEANERVDAALKRSGRLCRSMHVAPLEPEHAMRVFQRLTGVPPMLAYSEPTPLCDIYRLARDRGWKPAKADQGRGAGFHLNQPPPSAPDEEDD